MTIMDQVLNYVIFPIFSSVVMITKVLKKVEAPVYTTRGWRERADWPKTPIKVYDKDVHRH
jgi:hypothetical protein